MGSLLSATQPIRLRAFLWLGAMKEQSISHIFCNTKHLCGMVQYFHNAD